MNMLKSMLKKLVNSRLFAGYSYCLPEEVWLCTDTVCNVQCKFCSYDINDYKIHSRLSVSDIQKMSWLKHPRFIALFASGGDPLANKDFSDIVLKLRERNPKCHLYISTNGKGLDERNMAVIADNVDVCHISMNAIQRTTYEKIIERGNYDQMVNGVKYLAAKKRVGIIELSMILMRSTLDDLKLMIDFQAQTGCEKLVVSHYICSNRPDRLPKEECLYGVPEVDDYIDEMLLYAKKLGVEVTLPLRSKQRPLDYTQDSEQVSDSASEDYATKFNELIHWECSAPQNTVHLVPDLVGNWQLQLCCNGSTGIRFDKALLYKFNKLWNCNRVREIRASVNLPPLQQNRLCFNCRNQNQYDPNDTIGRKKLHNIRPDAVAPDGTPIVFDPVFINDIFSVGKVKTILKKIKVNFIKE